MDIFEKGKRKSGRPSGRASAIWASFSHVEIKKKRRGEEKKVEME
jgi:hypothetical protein